MPCLVVLGCLALAACDHEPAFDASSLPAYQKSLGEIKTRLSAQDQRKLQVALLTLAAGSSADYTAFAVANPNAVTNFEALENVANPLTFLDRMRPAIEGHTAASVIRHVAADLDYTIARAEQEANGPGKVLAGVVVEHPRFSWDRSRSKQPTVDFSVYNGSKNPIATLYLTGTLTAPGLDTPLSMGDLSYHFETTLQPGVQEAVRVVVGFPGPWTAKQLETSYDNDFKLKVSNVGDAYGTKLLAVGIGWLDVMRKKRDILRGS